MQEKLIVAGNSEICRTPPFLYVNEEMEEKILKQYPETLEYKKFYIVTSKAFVNGNIIEMFPAVNVKTRADVMLFCKEKNKIKEYCYFSKVIRTDGYVEKFWKEEYHLNRIQNRNRKKYKRIIKKAKTKKIFYNSSFLLIEKTKSELPEWLRVPIIEENKKFSMKGKITVLSSFKNFAVIKSKNLIDGDHNTNMQNPAQFFTGIRREVFPYTNTVGFIRLNKRMINSQIWTQSLNKSCKRLVELTNSKVFNYFKLVDYCYRDEAKDELILAYIQSNDMTDASYGIPMEVYLALIQKHLTSKLKTENIMEDVKKAEFLRRSCGL